jgi:hypothetical protein
MAYAWTEGAWWPQRHEPPGNLEVALANFGASARGGFGQEAAFDARFMLDQHFQLSSSQPSSFTQQSSSFTQQSPTDTRHGDSYGIPQDGYSPWQPLQHQADDVSITGDDMVLDDSMLDATGNEGTGLHAPGMGGPARQTELPSDGTSCRDV